MYEVHEWKHAAAILAQDFPEELDDILAILRGFRIKHADIVVGGGGKSPVAKSMDAAFVAKGWNKKRWETAIHLDGVPRESPTHEVDSVKGRVALSLSGATRTRSTTEI